jgi:hypothetical protein
VKYQSQRTDIAWFHIHEVSKISKLPGAERRMVVARAWGKGKGSVQWI